ncbi:hypothetical protein FACS1894188_01090 [Clostridia bacterium]|nr:hypothetical protein FACS1894188_01090 [Clostridia bacterium]
MLHPSYTELLEIMNENADMDNQITSRYTIVIAAAKRARQLVSGARPLTTGVLSDKAVSIAVKEMAEGKVRITPVEIFPDEGVIDIAKLAVAAVVSDAVPPVAILNFDTDEEGDDIDDIDDFDDVDVDEEVVADVLEKLDEDFDAAVPDFDEVEEDDDFDDKE